MKLGTLYLIPNTLGQDDISLELNHLLPNEVALITSQLDYFIVENAKTARSHLKRIDKIVALKNPLQAISMATLSVNTPSSELPKLLEPILAGKDAGLISEAGVPAVADPGAQLVALAHQHHIRVKPLVGPSSLLLALMASGLNGQRFAFHGYLPTQDKERNKKLRQLEAISQKDNQTQLFIETPYRNIALLNAICANCRVNTKLCVATHLACQDESIVTKTIADWKHALSHNQLPDLHKKPTVFLLLAQ